MDSVLAPKIIRRKRSSEASLHLQLGLHQRHGIDDAGQGRVFFVTQHRAGALEDGGNPLSARHPMVFNNGGGRDFFLRLTHGACSRRSRKSRHSGKPRMSLSVRFGLMGQIVLAATLGLTQVLPVRRPVARPAIAARDR